MKYLKPWTTEEEELVKELYPKMSASQMTQYFTDRSQYSIRAKANDMGIKKWNNKSRSGKRSAKYSKDDQFFNEPNEMNCSIAGLIASDGCIGKTERSCCISLGFKLDDIFLLEEVKKATQFTGDIAVRTQKPHGYSPKETNTCHLNIYSSHEWAEDLDKNWNIVPRKSLILTGPNIKDLDLCLSYISGIVNGDGCIGLYKSGKNKDSFSLKLSVYGTEELLIWIKQCYERYLEKPLKPIVRKDKKYKNVYVFTIHGYDAANIIEKIRSLDCILLPRKWSDAKVLSHIEKQKQKRPHKFIKK